MHSIPIKIYTCNMIQPKWHYTENVCINGGVGYVECVRFLLQIINIKFCVYCHVLNPMSTSSENIIVLHIIFNRFDTWWNKTVPHVMNKQVVIQKQNFWAVDSLRRNHDLNHNHAINITFALKY